MTRVPCIVCGAMVPLENLRLYWHVTAHKAGIIWKEPTDEELDGRSGATGSNE
jgi:hypothetical protein